MTKRLMWTVAATAMLVAAMSTSGGGQWLGHPQPGVPLGPDGKPKLDAPTPKTADGRPDLSGVWQSRRDAPGAAGGIEGIIAPRYMIDLTIDMAARDTLLRPAAAAIYKARRDNQYRDNPSILCLPLGVPRLDSYTHPYKIVQTPEPRRDPVPVADAVPPDLHRRAAASGRPSAGLVRAIRSAGGTATPWWSARPASPTRPGSTAAVIRTARR